jgi:hypothetical protein
MTQDQPISWLMFFTLAAGVVIIGGAFLQFIRSRSNREIASDTLTGDGRGRGAAADGALPELAALTVFAFIAMGLLTAGFNSKSTAETAQKPGPVGSTASNPATPASSTGNRTVTTQSTQGTPDATPGNPNANAATTGTAGNNAGMAQPAGSQNDQKVYQPANPAPDLRAAPTGSDTGVGASPGNTGTQTK